ncbi:acyl-ACP desaturase [Streptomyces parvulus]|uniref:Acyl-ACP desaturase n=1 Tax=Streptomyces parvulus TaxID=146923 RepID=A0A191V5P6_9ACTN|nr:MULTISPECIES: acyl-ACP desaturase [Streptomyces]ANJ10223.1 acyl-ACP desaturase [Streptomyces parvulus]MCC9153878.1 acyl-ACP desaturase [Streptomyces parvulus]MCE7689740.1 acyl-ACP desaturase [Streptomyces parvulus]MCQ4194524.1 acyl-ACP desaturase [Streptomyces parvulus]WHM29750.1 acyl-ACP desaturase [Streptomyces sp. BPPL-273]
MPPIDRSDRSAGRAEHALLADLQPVVEANLHRHLGVAKEWFPHEYIPWSEGRTFDGPLGGEPWTPDEATLPEVARTSLVVNLLTEDNLPGYHFAVAEFGKDGAWGTWVDRWTAEEARHGTALRDYLLATRAVDPRALERARMTHMEGGYDRPDGYSALHAIAYAAFQELATRISHRNTGVVSGEPRCDALLARIAADENLHMVFYRNLVEAAFELAPDTAMEVVRDVVVGFEMPGSTIKDFGRKSAEIAIAGIYDLRLHHDSVVMPILRRLRVFEREGFGAPGEAAREELAAFVRRLDTKATSFTDRREGIRAARAQREAMAV